MAMDPRQRVAIQTPSAREPSNSHTTASTNSLDTSASRSRTLSPRLLSRMPVVVGVDTHDPGAIAALLVYEAMHVPLQ